MWGYTFVSAATSSDKSSVWPTVWAAVGALVALATFLSTLSYIPSHRLIYIKRRSGRREYSPPWLRRRISNDPAVQKFWKIAKDRQHSSCTVIILAGRGRKDTTRENFYQGGPVVVEVDSPIAAVLQYSSPEWYRAPAATMKDKCLEIGPDFISRKQRLMYFLLVDGEKPKVRLQSALTDVGITRRANYIGALGPATRWFGLWLLILVYMALVAWLFLTLDGVDVSKLISNFFAPMLFLRHGRLVIAANLVAMVFGVAGPLALISGRLALKRQGATSDILEPVRSDPVTEDKSNVAASPSKEVPSAPIAAE